jgi:hypothetical protein
VTVADKNVNISTYAVLPEIRIVGLPDQIDKELDMASSATSATPYSQSELYQFYPELYKVFHCLQKFERKTIKS